MSTQYFVRAVDLETSEETVDGPFPTEVAAIAFAQTQAEEFYGGDDVTWYDLVAPNYLVGRVFEDGSRSEPLVTITVEAQEVEIEEDPTM